MNGSAWTVVQVSWVRSVDVLASLEPGCRKGHRGECEGGQDSGATHNGYELVMMERLRRFKDVNASRC